MSSVLTIGQPSVIVEAAVNGGGGGGGGLVDSCGGGVSPMLRDRPLLLGKPQNRRHRRVSDVSLKLYVDTFHMLDLDKDGLITPNDLVGALYDLGYFVTMEQACKMVQTVDENNDGMIDVNEYLAMISRQTLWKQPNLDEEVQMAFKLFDRKKDEVITIEELRETMYRLGQPLTKKEARAIFRMMNTSGNGRISYAEFKVCWIQLMSTIDSLLDV